jgi:hypothetical protein
MFDLIDYIEEFDVKGLFEASDLTIFFEELD